MTLDLIAVSDAMIVCEINTSGVPVTVIHIANYQGMCHIMRGILKSFRRI